MSLNMKQPFAKAQDGLLNGFRKCNSWLRTHRFKFLQAFLLLIRFGQVVTAGLTCASFVQLYIVTLIYLLGDTAKALRSQFGPRFKAQAQYHALPLTVTDMIPTVLYVVGFIMLSDYVVPTGILRGSRPGTTCYLQQSYWDPVVLKECVMGQHGYWWSMGAMLSYVFTSVVYLVFAIRESAANGIVQAIKNGKFRTGPEEIGSTEESQSLLGADTQDELISVSE
ncbi:MAG: hypothetical protein M1814_004572 [Vezdaea aestivalis]|nr:MAG: hypothetical protein M1814_004572 [Vezdaea aestivalis]